jgi:uncharacterized membrane protein YphA (DoxX/SURF4 family)
MSIASTLERLHLQAKENRWLWLFSIFNRLALAAGFIPSGMVKILGERFASGVNANHPMGHYLEALHTTGYYYTFIGVIQVTAAILLLIPRTATLGAFLYFPIILNICILTFAVRFDGSLFTAPLMVLANLYLLGWDYEKWKYILPFNRPAISDATPKQKSLNNKFPIKFFAGVAAAVIVFMLVIPNLYDVLPKNSLLQCQKQFKGKNRAKAGDDFCDCVHKNGEPLDKCLDEYEKAADDIISTR